MSWRWHNEYWNTRGDNSIYCLKFVKFYGGSILPKNQSILYNLFFLEFSGYKVYFKGDFTCIRWGWTYLSINYKSSGTLCFHTSIINCTFHLHIWERMLLVWYLWPHKGVIHYNNKKCFVWKSYYVGLFLLRGKGFWNVESPQGNLWDWRKILDIRDIARPFIKHPIGNGQKLSYGMPFATLMVLCFPSLCLGCQLHKC